MANNRLYLIDKETNEAVLLAKSFGSGWNLWPKEQELQDFLNSREGSDAWGNTDKSNNLFLITENCDEYDTIAPFLTIIKTNK